MSELVAYGHVGRATPYWLWAAQRVSAVLLGPAVLVHVAIVDAWKIPAAQALLLVVVVTHGYVGAWRLMGGWRIPVTSAVASIVAAALTAALVVLALLVVVSLL